MYYILHYVLCLTYWHNLVNTIEPSMCGSDAAVILL